MNPTSQNIYNQGQQMANQFNQQAQGYGQDYSVAKQQAWQNQRQLQEYTASMADPGKLYGDYLRGAQQMYGFNPQDLLKANKSLANTQTVIANLPQAAQQQGNYYGTTAGAIANNYAQQAGNLNSVLQGQANTADAFQNVLRATQEQANQQGQLSFQGQQLKSTNLQNLYQNSLAQQNAAKEQMQYFSGLYQQQGYLSSQQAAQYAAAQNSYAQAGLAAAQAAQTSQQTQMAQQVSDQIRSLYGANPQQYTQALLGQLTGSNVSLPSVGGGQAKPGGQQKSAPKKQSAPVPFNRYGSTTGLGNLFTGFVK